ncbi:MAG: tyrosine-type recombinase/integrase, partial [Nitrosomonadaceae bacterium]
DLPAHLAVNEFDCAVGEAKKWFDNQQQGFRARPCTVQEAADNYTEYLEQKKGQSAADDAKGRIRLHILPEFAETSLDRLKHRQIRKWVHSCVAEGSAEVIRKSKATANRNLTTLKALLNLAYKEGLVLSDRAWRTVESFRNTDRARKDFLTSDQVKSLLDSADRYFHDLLKAGILTGARYGELCKLRVRDLDKDNKLLNIPGGKTGTRTFPLTISTMAFFKEMSKDKMPDAPLLTKNGADPWGTGDQSKLMREAVSNAELPDSVVFYTLRHSFIADVIDKNMNVFDIAKITGTSIDMIDKHYGKLFKDRVIEVLERTSLV